MTPPVPRGLLSQYLFRKEKLPQICNLLFLFTDTEVVQSTANFVVDFFSVSD